MWEIVVIKKNLKKGYMYNFDDLMITTFFMVRFLVVFQGQWLQLSSVSYREVWGLVAGLNTGSFSLVVYTVLVFYPALEIPVQILGSHIITLQNLQRLWKICFRIRRCKAALTLLTLPTQVGNVTCSWDINAMASAEEGRNNVRKEGQQKFQ